MGEQLVIPGAQPLVARLRVTRAAPDSAWMRAYLEAARRAYERISDPHADATKRTYEAMWRAWGAHCSALQLDPLPIDPDRLCTYLELLSTARAPSTVRLHLSALAALDQAWRVEQRKAGRSLRRHPRVQRWLSAWSKQHALRPEKQAPALSVEQIDAMLAAAAEPRANTNPRAHVALYTRDRALLLLGLCAALRVSELYALTARDVQKNERGLRVLVRRSKTDQHGAGHLRGVAPQARLSRCPVEAHRAWLAIRGEHDGPLYCPITRTGDVLPTALAVRQLQHVITERARAGGVPLASAHSLRATFATLAAQNERPLHRIADQGGWRSLDTLRGYVRAGSLFDDNASDGLLR